MEFIDPAIDQYATEHTSPESDLLIRITRETYAEVLMPRMLSGHLQGRILSMISKMVAPDMILEIGTYTGYSALCLAEGLSEKGIITTIDINEELEERVRGYFATSDFNSKINYRIGNALNIIPEMEHNFDLAFIDADKINYLNYYNMLLPKMRRGGIILADNVLWSGKVLEQDKADKDTKALIEFNESIRNDSRVEQVLLPVRDGLMVIRVVS